ncbi:tryptophan-rich sensory protein [Propionibacterium cyclohexanicum]|uniref:Tryptophan-rich sensory protein n=1 Tax=Propionibacterium cyclohexanicum TaxID=64702 RepID=A0A1H9TTR7_9ACTN|nr:TspO/MBR family protein [Propionibacterium cyclohexanicum]SES00615.1 tryptophan-rich sensory protein [Propionibacterium cyclohexanicum]
MSIVRALRRWTLDPGPSPRDRRIRNAVVSTSAVAATAVLGSLATEPEGGWYATLAKPSWQPPRAVFPIAWTLLYVDIAATSTLVLNELERRGDAEAAHRFRIALGANLVLNAGWCWLFFRGQNLPASAVVAGVLAASSTSLAVSAGRVRGRYGVLLGGYAAWTAFATALSGAIWKLNAG